MRKTKEPRTIVVQDRWFDRPEIQQLKVEGHWVHKWSDFVVDGNLIVEPDLILHEAAHRWSDMNWEANLWPAVKARLRAK